MSSDRAKAWEKYEVNEISTEESRWLDDQADKILGIGTDVWSKWDRPKRKKREWILEKYDVLWKLGYSPETIYKLIRRKIDHLHLEISDSYLRICIRKKSGITGFPRMAYYDYTEYLEFETVRQRFLEYLESGQYDLDRIRRERRQK